ncbi:hypothetical protein DdX_10555 [Ditylenchus destructor]|uniref:Uncharacterized protein n=1 Tax=Ditylenchus destructor TaxID=166010 RepID=A0AAD4MXZ7_9BILA|nr:hypothetical protein DdX_10555 [Ditylenchus destructor]
MGKKFCFELEILRKFYERLAILMSSRILCQLILSCRNIDAETYFLMLVGVSKKLFCSGEYKQKNGFFCVQELELQHIYPHPLTPSQSNPLWHTPFIFSLKGYIKPQEAVAMHHTRLLSSHKGISAQGRGSQRIENCSGEEEQIEQKPSPEGLSLAGRPALLGCQLGALAAKHQY